MLRFMPITLPAYIITTSYEILPTSNISASTFQQMTLKWSKQLVLSMYAIAGSNH